MFAIEHYEMRRNADSNTPNWMLGLQMNKKFVEYSNIKLTDKQAYSKSQTADIKAKMNTKVSRHLTTARNLIANVEKGMFSEKKL